jgi:hypothetical protein
MAMKTPWRTDPRAIVVALALVLTPSIVTGLAADEPAGSKPSTLVLFDGKSLDGWAKTAFTGAGDVKVEDGAIVMPAGRTMTGITTMRRDLPKTNYDLSYEAMRTTGDDFFAAATFPVGSSFITLVNGGWGGTITGLSSIDGADASENGSSQGYKYRNGTWYRFRVRVTDDVIRCWIDDKELLAVDHRDRQVGTRIETRRNEPLGFATWKAGGAVRKIEIRTLSPSEVAATPKVDQ